MTESYLMVSPFGEFYQNLNNEYIYSDKIHEVGVKTALGQVSFDYTKFVKRGGKYDLWIWWLFQQNLRILTYTTNHMSEEAQSKPI